MICTPKVRHFWRCIFFMVKKAQAKSTLPKRQGAENSSVKLFSVFFSSFFSFSFNFNFFSFVLRLKECTD